MKSKPPFRASSDQNQQLVGRILSGTQGETAPITSAVSGGADENGIKLEAVDIKVQMNNSRGSDLLKLAAIVQSSSDAILTTDIKGAITSWNPAAERLFGYPAEDVLGQPVSILIPLPSRENEERISSRICAGVKLPPPETTRRHKDGTHGGTGIGLPIARKAATRMGGRVGVESEPGKEAVLGSI